jgi:hypothetical protein
MKTFVWCCDPGKASGIVTGWYDDRTVFQIDAVTERFALTPNDAAVQVGAHLWQWLRGFRNATGVELRVITEGFITHSGRRTPGHIDGNWSIRPLGAIAVVMHQFADPRYTERQPGVPKSIPNDLLRAAGYWVKSKDDDSRSAMKHLLAQLQDEGHLPTIAAMKAGQEKLNRE